MDIGGRGDVKVRWDVAVFDDAVVTNNQAGADGAVEDHAVEAEKYTVADFAGAMNDGTVGNRGGEGRVDEACRRRGFRKRSIGSKDPSCVQAVKEPSGSKIAC